jgi:25S rRNA (adenine2142-N1)-methyltransferase
MAKNTGFLKRSRSITGKTFTKPSIKPQHTRKIIRRYHLLLNKRDIIYQKLSEIQNKKIDDENIKKFNKEPLQESKPTDEELLGVSSENDIKKLFQLLRKIEYENEKSGGLAKYQAASLYGQETKRGSDSSKWLFDNVPELKESNDMTALEIGSLSTKNHISKHFKGIIRIDLNSNEPGIIKQDFMQRPLPKSDKDRFDVISCSLVLNFVPTPAQRGDMMKRFTEFIIPRPTSILFIVLPLSCLTNSRYCDKSHFIKICESLGFELIQYHEAKKLVYLALRWTHNPDKKIKYTKKKLHDGPIMNNFSITL